jgi:hypothetical protein
LPPSWSVLIHERTLDGLRRRTGIGGLPVAVTADQLGLARARPAHSESVT